MIQAGSKGDMKISIRKTKIRRNRGEIDRFSQILGKVQIASKIVC